MPNVNDETIYQAGTLLVNIVRQAMGIDALGSLEHGEMVSTAIQKHPIVITQQPKMFVGEIGETCVFHVEAEGDDLSYQWEFHNGTRWYTTSVSGNRTPTITMEITQARFEFMYRCVITNGDGYSIISDAVRILEPN